MKTALIIFFVIIALGNVLSIGQPRKPKTPNEAALDTSIWGLLIFIIVRYF